MDHQTVVIIKHTKRDYQQLPLEEYRETSDHQVRVITEFKEKIKNFGNLFSKRYYLFSKFDQGVEID